MNTPVTSPIRGELSPFEEYARAENLRLAVAPTSTGELSPSLQNLDMKLVRLSLANAIERAGERPELRKRLGDLLDTGTAAQQIDFVLRPWRVFYFPNDVERMAAAGPQAAHSFATAKLRWLRCVPCADSSHLLEEVEREICIVH